MTIGSRIRKRRTSLGMSQEELAYKLGYTNKTTISKIESGVNDIPQLKIRAFADALRTTVNYILGTEDDASIPSSDKYFDYRFPDGTSFTIITDNQDFLSKANKWKQCVNEYEFTDEEMEEMMNYAKFIISKRK